MRRKPPYEGHLWVYKFGRRVDSTEELLKTWKYFQSEARRREWRRRMRQLKKLRPFVSTVLLLLFLLLMGFMLIAYLTNPVLRDGCRDYMAWLAENNLLF